MIDLAKQLVLLVAQLGSMTPKTRDERIAVGQRLWTASKRLEEILDVIKASLRSEAGGGGIRFEAPDGSQCHVLSCAPSLELRKGMTGEELKTRLGPRYGQYFEDKVTLRKDFKAALATCSDPTEKAFLLSVVTEKENTPRVVFKE